jgi:uncharacterized membrane protein (DUF485 family)
MTPPPAPPTPGALLEATRRVAAERWRKASLLTAGMIVVYFGFILLVAFRPALLATPLGDGLSVGILLGALVIVSAWVLTWSYVRWANRVYDPALARLREEHRSAGGAP